MYSNHLDISHTQYLTKMITLTLTEYIESVKEEFSLISDDRKKLFRAADKVRSGKNRETGTRQLNSYMHT